MSLQDAFSRPATYVFGLLWGVANVAAAAVAEAPWWVYAITSIPTALVGVGACLKGWEAIGRLRFDRQRYRDEQARPPHRCKPWSPPYDG